MMKKILTNVKCVYKCGLFFDLTAWSGLLKKNSQWNHYFSMGRNELKARLAARTNLHFMNVNNFSHFWFNDKNHKRMVMVTLAIWFSNI